MQPHPKIVLITILLFHRVVTMGMKAKGMVIHIAYRLPWSTNTNLP